MSTLRSAVAVWATAVALVAAPLVAWGQSISAGNIFSCGVNTAGAARCWGDNRHGQLGNGVTGGVYYSAVAVSGLGSGVARISAGGVSACAVTTAGAVRCWGSNIEGQLGNGSAADSNVPVQVTGLTSGVQSVSVGALFACALTTSGQVYCWGRNQNGQLGQGSIYQRSNVPVLVPGLSGVTSIVTGDDHVCAHLSTGTVRCWGSNFRGQIGTGVSGNNHPTPTQPTGLSSGVRAVAAGKEFSCALMTDGTSRCWGDNGWGQLGTNDNTPRLVPTTVLTRSGFALVPLEGQGAIFAGGSHVCSLISSIPYCWGQTESPNTYLPARNTSDLFSSLELGSWHRCGITTSGVARCWGRNSYGELGNNTGVDSYTSAVSVVGF